MNTRLAWCKEPVAGFTHLAAGVAAIGGGIALWLGGQGDLIKQFSLLVYSLSLVGQYAASSAYHLIRTTPSATVFLRKIDHASIFFLIAGSYTPVVVNVLDGAWRWGVLVGIWTVALVGIAFKFATIKTRRWINVSIFLAMGWFGLIPAARMLPLLPLQAFGWLLLEAALFSIGAVIYATKRLDFFPGVFGFHELWHLFVIGGSVSHFMLVLLYVVPYIRAG